MNKPLQATRPIGALLVELLPDGRLQVTKQGDAQQALCRLLALLPDQKLAIRCAEAQA
ncbi:hypothetical protein [Chromobacterium amazonense]|uniref:hypothetical protein n=1 Tax=Chromobacterium amazonense TaxID=1382803 RepID=UPI0016708B0F|nr:hypothetical protein [Chromobacterium amazonense]